MSDTPTPPSKAGLIRFSDAYMPAIQAGAYRLVMQQSVQVGTQGTPGHHYYRDQRFIVQGPRYQIDANDIHACHPQEGATGNVQHEPPYIVLNKRALPWERQPWTNQTHLPWMALLVLSQDEFEAAGGDACMHTLPVSQLEAQDNAGADKVLMPVWPKETPAGTDAKAEVIDLPLALLSGLFPSEDDLRYLAHVRMVDTASKAALNMHADGEFAVIMANRLPQQGTNRVFLVSLEGWQALVTRDGTITAAASGTRARLVLLRTWSFIHDERQHYGFGHLLGSLDKTALGESFVQGLPPGPTRQALQSGHIPLEYRPRNMPPAWAWYRGPLVPVEKDDPTVPRPDFSGTGPVFHTAEAATARHQDTVNLAYAIAWRLGRMLALSSAAYSGAWRTFFGHKPEQTAPLQGQGTEQTPEIDPAQRLVNFIETHIAALERIHAPRTEAKPGETLSHAESVACMIHWLTRLLLLHPVSFMHLIADERLLPKESLRCFYMDMQWQEALADGALSLDIGAALPPLARAQRRNALGKIIDQAMHFRTTRHYLHGQSGQNWLETPWSGFLLRSDLVSGWPGLEIEVEEHTGQKLTPLRFERLSENVLFCLLPRRFHKLTLKEPAESLKFAVPIIPSQEGMVSEKGVLNVSAIAAGLNTAQAKDFASAAFARHMVQSGEIQTIEWHDAPRTA